MKLRAAQRVLAAGCLPILSACASTNKLVVMEYDHRLNFSQYHFAQAVSTGTSAYTDISTDGTWLVYHICTIKNDDSEAENFPFTLSKFYVVDANGAHFVSDVKHGDLTTVIGNIPGDYPYINNAFKSEVHTAPVTQTIPANSTSYLSVSWRFAILVRPPVGINPHDIKPGLRYESSPGESVLLVDRGHEPNIIPPQSAADENDLYPNCRPKLD